MLHPLSRRIITRLVLRPLPRSRAFLPARCSSPPSFLAYRTVKYFSTTTPTPSSTPSFTSTSASPSGSDAAPSTSTSPSDDVSFTSSTSTTSTTSASPSDTKSDTTSTPPPYVFSKYKFDSPISWKSVALLVIVGSGLVAYYQYTRERSMIIVRPVKTIGKAQLGGPFTLVDENGKTVTSEDLKGKYVLLYFGFTHCPDICPTELRKMEKALEIVASLPNMPSITPVFISIDPRRDTPERLKTYKKSWSPNFLWLTGTNEQIGAVAKAYRVYFSAPEIEPGQEDDYLVDHSIFFYLLDRNGEFMDVYGKNLSAEEVAFKMQQTLNEDHQVTATA